MNQYRCILSLRIARQLLTEGFELHDIEPSRKRAGTLVYIFANSKRLERRLTEFKR